MDWVCDGLGVRWTGCAMDWVCDGLGVRWTGCAMDWVCDGLVDWVCSTWGRTSCGLGMRGLGVLDVVRGVVLDMVQVDNGHGGQWL